MDKIENISSINLLLLTYYIMSFAKQLTKVLDYHTQMAFKHAYGKGWPAIVEMMSRQQATHSNPKPVVQDTKPSSFSDDENAWLTEMSRKLAFKN